MFITSPALGSPRARAESGSAMIIVMVILVALLGAGAIAVHLQMSDTRSTGLIRSARAALYCAEAGLQRARPIVGANYATWGDTLDGDPGNDPGWYPITGDLDGDGTADYTVTIRDNDDELSPNPNDPTRDNDLTVFVVSTCTRYPDTPREVLEMITYEGGGSLYRNQAGCGPGNTGNCN